MGGYGQKLLTSGFSREKVVDVLVSGIRCYERKVRRCRKNGWKLYRTAKGSMKTRQMKKLIGNKSWYRQKRKREEDDEIQRERQDQGRKMKRRGWRRGRSSLYSSHQEES